MIPKALAEFFPTNDGFIGEISELVLKPGQRIDRFGGTPASQFFSPAGVPKPLRSLPPDTAQQSLRVFEVARPFKVNSGQVAPAFGQIGLGTQFKSSKGLQELLDEGFLREITN